MSKTLTLYNGETWFGKSIGETWFVKVIGETWFVKTIGETQFWFGEIKRRHSEFSKKNFQKKF